MTALLSVAVGDRFARGVVIEVDIWVAAKGRPGGLRGARLQCDCGNVYESPLFNLLNGRTQSCGCMNREQFTQWAHSLENIQRLAGLSNSPENIEHLTRLSRSQGARERQAKRMTTHGLTHHELYFTWTSMMRRCTDENDVGYHRYGGCGITLVEKWRDDPTAFIEYVERELGPRPEGCSIDRIEPYHGNYEPGGVRWATAKEQANNRRVPGGCPIQCDDCRRLDEAAAA